MSRLPPGASDAPALTTARLVLEPLRVGHAAEIFPVLCDPALYAFENAPPESLAALAARYLKLESRVSPDGQEIWLNWVVFLAPEGGAREAIGVVQATVFADGSANIAYEFGSAYWGRGLASEATAAMLGYLESSARAASFRAVYKTLNRRSERLLARCGFRAASAAERIAYPEIEPDESMMLRPGATPGAAEL